MVFGLQASAPAANARRSVGTRAGETAIGRILKRAKRRAMRGAASRGELGLSPEAERFFSQIGLIADPRKVDRARRRFRRAFDAGGELGLSPETVELFRRAGLFADPKSSVVPPLSIVEPLIRGGAVLGDSVIRGARATAAAGLDDFTPATEPFLRGGAFAKDILALGIGAAIDGTLGGFNQVLRELDVSKTTADKLERDFRLLALVGGKAASTRPAAVTGAATPARMFGQEIREAGVRDMRRVGRQAMRDLGRPRIPQTSTVGEFAKTIDDVLTTGQSAVETVFRSDLGAITIDLGKKGKVIKFRRRGQLVRKIEGGSGLRKIIQKRTRIDGLDGQAFVRETLPKLLSEGRLVGFIDSRIRREQRGIADNRRRRAIIEDKDNRAILSLFRKGNRETWLLTAFQKKN